MIFKIEKNNKDISDVIIFSDGFENSFNYYNQMIDSLNNTIREYKKNVFSFPDMVDRMLQNTLN